MINAALDNIEPRSQQAALAAPGTAAPDAASLADEAPSKSEKRKITFEDMKPWLPLTACMAWILARDPSEVIALSRPLPAIDKVAAHIRLSRLKNRTIKGARHELIKALEERELTARSDQGDIPSEYWSRFRSREWLYEDGTDRVGEYRDVVIARAQMIKYWRGEERRLTDKQINDWLISRIKADKLDGIKAMWEACKQELGGQVSRVYFAKLRKVQMGISKRDAPRPGRRPGR